MRQAFAFILLTGFTVLAQEPPLVIPKDPEPHYGVPAKIKVYPQTTAKKALESAIDACEKNDYTYLVAHLLDPIFIESRIVERSKQYEAAVELELSKLRDFQYANPDRFPPADRVPMDRQKFLTQVIEQSRDRAFKQVIREVEQKLRDDPQTLKDMKKMLRDGTFTDEGAGAKVVQPTVKDRTLFFKKIGDRWYLENRQTDEPKKEP
jgi:hypothetical protein